MRQNDPIGLIYVCAIGCLSSCYTGVDASEGLPEGNVLLAREQLPSGAIIQISVAREAYEEDPSAYADISIALDDDVENPAASGDFVDILDGAIELGPDGSKFRSPVYLQAFWSATSTSLRSTANIEDAKWYLYDRDIDLWLPMPTSLDTSGRMGGVWLDHFSEYMLGLPVNDSVNSVQLLSPAIFGSNVVFELDTTLAPSESIVCKSSCGQIAINKQQVTISSAPVGISTLIIKEGLFGKWIQDFYVSPSAQQINFSDWTAIAEKYRPILQFSHHHETLSGRTTCSPTSVADELGKDNYRPVALSKIFSPNIKLWMDQKQGTGPVAARYMAKHATTDRKLVSSQNGALETLTWDGGNPTVYWHVARIGSTSRRLITYWMFYPWDPKSPDLSLGHHAMDRESISVELSCSGGPETCLPVAAWYGAHLDDHHLYFIDPEDGENIYARWDGDALRVPWNLVEHNSAHCEGPAAYVAYGSHALFPRSGIYHVDAISWRDEVGGPPSGLGGGTEAACGDADRYGNYELRPLDMSKISSATTTVEAAFLFSGSWVAALKNEKFPPFLDRFSSQGTWTAEAEARNASLCANASCISDIACISGEFVDVTADNDVISVWASVRAGLGVGKWSLVIDDLPPIESVSFANNAAPGTAEIGVQHDISALGLAPGQHDLALWARDVANCGNCVPLDKVKFIVEASCPDGYCDPGDGESCDSCPDDCGSCGVCGDDVCESPENCATCPADCTCPASCPDGVCGAGEDCGNCPQDCACDDCGNGIIDGSEECDTAALGGETCQTLGYSQGTLLCLGSCTYDESGCCSYQHSILNAGDQTFTPFAAGCALDGGVRLLLSAEQISQSVIRFYIQKSDGSAWGVAADVTLYVGVGPTCGDPINDPKATAPVIVGATMQQIDLTIDPYAAGWNVNEVKQFWVGKSESGYAAARATGTISIERTSCQ